MKLLAGLLVLLCLTSCDEGKATNSIKRIYTEDIARDFVRIDFTNSIGVVAPSISDFDVNEVNPTAVIMIDDTSCYLQFASDFTTGASLVLDFTNTGTLLGGLGGQINTVVENRITAATVFHWTTADFANYFGDYTTNFNTDKSVPEGSIIKLAPGNYGIIDIAWLTDVTFAAEYSLDSVLFTYFNVREKGLHFGLCGHPAIPSNNIKIRNGQAFFGMGIFATGRIRLQNLEIHHVVQGIQVKTVPDILEPPYNYSRTNYQAPVMRFINVHDVTQEAFYIGSDIAAPLIPIYADFWACSVLHSGRDAYQFRNGKVYLDNCTMQYVGEGLDDAHSHGFLYGTTTLGGYVSRLTGSDIRGYGIQVNGYGTLTFKNCNISSGFNVPYIKNYDGNDDYHFGGLVVNFMCTNTFNSTGAVDPRTPDIRMDPAKTSIVVNVSNETVFSDPTYIETSNGVVWNPGLPCNKTYINKTSGKPLKAIIVN